MKQILVRLLFVLASTAVMVFFSEKAFWYPQGYVIGELILFYAAPVYATLWAIDHFRVRRLPALVLTAALFGFLAEGVLTPVIYEAGLLDPLLPGYFIGWHGLLSVIFGWYFLRKWLVAGQWRKLLVSAALFGSFWGFWSITYWLPQTFEDFALPGQWPTLDFGLHALTFTLMLMAAHWALGQNVWQTAFKPSRPEKWVIWAALAFFYATLSFPVVPFGFVKLAVLLTAVYIPLRINRQREREGSLLTELAGTVKAKSLLPLLAMPVMATAVYSAAVALEPSEEILGAILELTPLAQSFLGIGLFVWAIAALLRPSPSTQPAAQGELA
jgi:hypothetical protein